MNKLSIIFCLLGMSIGAKAQPSNTRLNSPEVLSDNSVVFRVKAPEANSVSVVGTFAKDFKPVPLVKNDSNIYEVKIGPLSSDMYEYRIVLDGIPVLDPNNNAVTRDGNFIENRLLIPGELGNLLATQDVPHGRVTAVWYPSPTLGGQRRMFVYTPAGYEQGKDKYPVMYLLHGGGGDEDGWINRGRANDILDNLIASKKAVPMIVVVTNGNPDAVAAPLDRPLNKVPKDTGIGGMASMRFEQSFVKDVIPYIEKNYRVIADANHRALTGFSMGGFQTQNITNNNPGMFNYIGVMSMGLFSSFRGAPNTNYDKDKHVAQLKALMAAKPKLYWIGIGKTDFLYESVTKLRALYDEVGVKYVYRESEGSHTWKEWRLYLTELAPQFFK
ncbi:MAG: alpha/beta hydrolase-fold protein [Chryseolinea sp.]